LSGQAETASFREVCGHFPTGVTAITAVAPNGELAALTANSFTSVSLEPPLVLVCVGHRVSSAPVMASASQVAIHVLGSEHEQVARRLATSGLSGEERLQGVDWEAGEQGVPLLADCVTRLAGPVVDRVDAGDHLIVIVEAAVAEIVQQEAPALLFYRGAFAPSLDPE